MQSPPPRWPEFPEQDENGVDLSLIRQALSLTVEERMARSEAGRRQALWLQQNARRIRAASPPDSRRAS